MMEWGKWTEGWGGVYGDTATTVMGQVPGSEYLADSKVDSPPLIL